MFEFIEAIFPMIFLGYFSYIFTIPYCLIAMFIQIVFSYFIVGKHIMKFVILIFLTQGIVIPIAEMNHDMIYSIIHYSESLGLRNVVISDSFRFNILYSLILFSIIIVIVFFRYRSIEEQLNYKKLIALLFGYFINIIIMVFMMLKFDIILKFPS